jgi:hypothetical protein
MPQNGKISILLISAACQLRWGNAEQRLYLPADWRKEIPGDFSANPLH